MRIVFMGSADLSCLCLRALLSARQHTVVGVVTQPDRPRGRHLCVSPCVARIEAGNAGLPVLTPQNVNTTESVERLSALAPDVIVVVAYGQILKPAILGIPLRGCINMHYSSLPKYRGAAPIQWAIANGEGATGVTAMFMNARMDAGDIIRQTTVPITEDDTACSLHDRLGHAGARLLVEVLDDLASDRVTRTPQDESAATPAPKLRKADGRIDWTRTAHDLYNQIRAFNPWPACFCMVPDRKRPRLRVLASRQQDGAGDAPPGTVVALDGDGPVIATGAGGLRLLDVQPEGGKRMSGADYARGHALAVGDRLQ